MAFWAALITGTLMTESKDFSHLDAQGKARMVDVGEKEITERIAKAQAVVHVNDETMRRLVSGGVPKGDVLACARIGGIMAAKRTSELIPLCHNIPLSYAGVEFEILESPPRVRVITECRCRARTGVEMEALTAAQCAAAVIYDMCKALQRDIIINDVRLLYKSGGRSGVFTA